MDRVLRKVKVRDVRATGYHLDWRDNKYPVAIVGEMYICSEKETREQVKKDLAKAARKKQ